MGENMIPINLPKIGEEEIEAAVKVMKSGMSNQRIRCRSKRH